LSATRWPLPTLRDFEAEPFGKIPGLLERYNRSPIGLKLLDIEVSYFATTKIGSGETGALQRRPLQATPNENGITKVHELMWGSATVICDEMQSSVWILKGFENRDEGT
jgi:hypothetical protein